MSSDEELLLLSAAASAAMISLALCGLERRKNMSNDFECVRCSNIPTKEGRTTHSWQNYDWLA